jgi:hypothetical protein
MFSISIYILYSHMEEHQLRIRTTVLFVGISSSLSCRNLGSSGPTLNYLFIHPVVVMCTARHMFTEGFERRQLLLSH